VNKFIQYSAKIAFYVLTQRAGAVTKTAEKCSKLSSGISNARKVDRLLKSTVEIQKMLDALHSTKESEFHKYLMMLSAACYAMYWFCDNKLFLGKLKVMDNVDLKAVSIRGHRYWLVGLVIVMYFAAVKMQKVYRERKELSYSQSSDEDAAALRALDEELFLKRVQFFGYCMDILVALNNSGLMEMMKGSKLNDGQYGVVGFLSASTVLYRMWPKTKFVD